MKENNFWNYPIRNQYNTVIIGAGITGLSLAYWLKKNNPKEKILVCGMDSNQIASRRNAGFLTSGSLEYRLKLIMEQGYNKASQIWGISKKNRTMVLEFLDKYGVSDLVDLKSLGSTTYINKDETEKIDVLIKLGFSISSESTLNNDKYVGVFDAQESSFNPLKFHDILMSVVKMMGVEVCLNNEITSIAKKDRAWELNKNITTKKLLLATNSSKFTKETFGKSSEIIRTRAQIQAYELSLNIEDTSNVYIPSSKIYFRVSDNKLIIGGLREVDKYNELTDKQGLNATIQDALKEFVINEIDSKAEPINQWSGIMGMSKNNIPRVEIDFKNSVYSIGGYSGHGNAFAFYLAKELIDSILIKKVTKDLELFR